MDPFESLVSEFAGKAGLSLQTLDKYSNLGFGQHTREIICHGIAPAEE